MIEISRCEPADVRGILAAAFSPKANPEGRYSVDTICNNGMCFRMTQGGEVVGAYVVEAFGAELWITAAAGAAEVDLSNIIAVALMFQARDFDAVVFKTVRPGLMKKAIAQGYTCTMRKNLK